MKTIFEFIVKSLASGHDSVLIVPDQRRGKLKVTITRNVAGNISENKIVRNERFCKTINTYRCGKKSGMQIITSEEFELTSLHGDPADQPLKRPSATSDSLYDTSR
jgi:hypothetical protein